MATNFGQGAPGVRIIIQDNSQVNLNVSATTIGGVVGFSSRGAFNKILSLNSPAQMDSVLGNGFNNPVYNQGLYAGKAILRNGGFLEFVRPYDEIDTEFESELKSDTFVVSFIYNTLSNPLEVDKIRNSFDIKHFASTRFDDSTGYKSFGTREIFKIEETLNKNTNIDFSLNSSASSPVSNGYKKVALFSIINEDPTAANRALSEDDGNNDSIVITTASYKIAHHVTDILRLVTNPLNNDTILVRKHDSSNETFTFVTTLNPVPDPNEVKLGSSVEETALNLRFVLANHPDLILEMLFSVTGNKVTAISYFGIDDVYSPVSTFNKVFSSGIGSFSTFQPSVEDSYVLLSSGLGRNFLNIGLAIESYVKDKYDNTNYTRHFTLTPDGKDVAEIYLIVDYTFDGKVYTFQGTISPYVFGDINLYIGNSAEEIQNGFKFIINENDDLIGSIDDTNFNFAQSVFQFVVKCSTYGSGNHSLTGLAAVDTVAIVDGNRVLVTDQTNPINNGIYVAHAGAWIRATDSNNGSAELVSGSYVFVTLGTVPNLNHSFELTSSDPIILGTTALVFTDLGASNNAPLHTSFSHVAYDVNDPAIINSAIWTYDPKRNKNSNTLANAWELFLDKDQSDSDMLVSAGTVIANLFVKNSEELDFTVMDAMLEVCEKRKDMFCLLDGLDEPNIENALRKMGSVGSQGDKARWGAIFDGRSIFFDRTYTKLNVEAVKSIEMAGIISNNRRGGIFWIPPAGKDFGTIPGALASKQKYIRKYNFSEDPNSDIARLYDANINPTRVTDAGMIIYGQKTMLKRTTALNRLNVIMLVAGLHKKFEKFLDTKVFQGNTSALRASISATMNADLDRVKAANPPGLTAGLVICNDTNNTPDIIDANILMVDMLLQPTRTAEFITLRTTIQRTGDELKISSVQIIA